MNEKARLNYLNQLFNRNSPVLKTRSGLRLPRLVKPVIGNKISVEDKVSIAKEVSKALGKRYVERPSEITYKKGTEGYTKLRYDADELVVISKTKNLTAYIMTVTRKSPKHFRFTFVNRMHNYCLDIIEDLFKANSLRKDEQRNKYKRKEYQHNAYANFKLLGYISFLAFENGCILKKQYEEIALQLANCMNLLVAWTKSDN